MNEQNFSLATFLEEVTPLLSSIRELTNAVRSPGTPARSGLGASQTKLLVDAVHASDASDVVTMVMEQVVSSTCDLFQTNVVHQKEANNNEKAEEHIIRSGDKLITLLQIAQHNFALASRGSLETTNDNDLGVVRNFVANNAKAYDRCWTLAKMAKTEEDWNKADEDFARDSEPLSFGEIALFIRHDILPDLMDVVGKLRDAFPTASTNYRRKAQETYALLLSERPELVGRFRETGSPFFDEAREGRLAELQIASFYNGGSYNYTPIKPAAWQAASKADRFPPNAPEPC